jgi:hypothetical protein
MRAGMLLLVIQLLLVLSVAGKYLYERHTRPRVWARATNYDPNLPIRGRYLALQLLVDSCGLPHDPAHLQPGWKDFQGKQSPGRWDWPVEVTARDGKLVATDEEYSRSPSDVAHVNLDADRPCERAPLSPGVEYFIPDTARGPLPLQPGQELWVEVTVPESGPPRPIRLALSDRAGFRVLKLE